MTDHEQRKAAALKWLKTQTASCAALYDIYKTLEENLQPSPTDKEVDERCFEEEVEIWLKNTGHAVFKKEKVHGLVEALNSMIMAINDGAIDSPEIGGEAEVCGNSHKWHEEWLHHTQQALQQFSGKEEV